MIPIPEGVLTPHPKDSSCEGSFTNAFLFPGPFSVVSALKDIGNFLSIIPPPTLVISPFLRQHRLSLCAAERQASLHLEMIQNKNYKRLILDRVLSQLALLQRNSNVQIPTPNKHILILKSAGWYRSPGLPRCPV